MQKIESLKKEIKTIDELAELSSALEQTAARDIAQMREGILKSRPFFKEARKVHKVLRSVSAAKPGVLNKHLVIFVSLQWGMTGGLINRVATKAEQMCDRHEADLLITGKMGKNRFVNRNDRTVHFFSVPKRATYTDIEEMNAVVAKYAHVHYVYPQFESLGTQSVVTASLSSTGNEPGKKNDLGIKDVHSERFLIEPSPQEVVDYVNKAIIGIATFNYLSEALLAYSAAQMVAMRSASDNAKEEKKHLVFSFNKAKRELIDVKLREQYGSRMHSNKDDEEAL